MSIEGTHTAQAPDWRALSATSDILLRRVRLNLKTATRTLCAVAAFVN